MARFCENCGARLPEDARFCEECGARVPAAPAAFARTATMTEAAGIAVSRSRDSLWRYWDSPRTPTHNARNLLRFAEKEDKRLGKLGDRGGMLWYAVSPAGSLGQVYADEMNDGRPVLEWVFFAPGEGEQTLPSAPDALY